MGVNYSVSAYNSKILRVADAFETVKFCVNWPVLIEMYQFFEIFLVVELIKMQQYCMLSRIHLQMDKFLFFSKFWKCF